MSISQSRMEGFLEGLGESGYGRHALFHLKHTILDFLREEKKETAQKVYQAVFYILGLPEEDDRSVHLTDALKAYEEHAGAIMGNQREHFVHSVNVYLLGLSIYQGNERLQALFRQEAGEGRGDRAAFFFSWSLTALLHDMGYPVELSSRVLQEFVQRTTGLEISGFPAPEARIEIRNYEDFAIPGEEGLSPLEFLLRDLEAREDFRKWGLRRHLEFFPALMQERGFVDHGYYSAMILLRWYGLVGESFQHMEREVAQAAGAILLHNFYGHIWQKLEPELPALKPERHPLAFLLILSDELQEWNREEYGKSSRRENTRVIQLDAGEDSLIAFFHSLLDSRKASHTPVTYKRRMLERILDPFSIYPKGLILKEEVELLHEEEEAPKALRQYIARVENLAQGLYRRARNGEAMESLTDREAEEYHNQARWILEQLEEAGCLAVSEDADIPEILEFTQEEAEILAASIHIRRKEEAYGEGVSESFLTDPCMGDWEEMEEGCKGSCYQEAEALLPLLREAGLKGARKGASS